MNTKRILSVLSFALLSVLAFAQSISISPLRVLSGTGGELVVNLEGVGENMTALQFNLSIPEGVTLKMDEVSIGNAIPNHTFSTRSLSNGDTLFVVYEMDLAELSNGKILRIPVSFPDKQAVYEGNVSVVRIADIDEVCYEMPETTYTINVGTATIESLIYTYDSTANTYSLTGYSSNVPEVVSLPSAIDGIPVVAIAEGALKGCTSIESLTIPASVTSVGASAFENCASLKTVVMPAKIYTGQEAVFQGCSNLTSVTLPSKLKIIGTNMFSDCTSLQSISIPETVTNIKYGAFRGCSNLSEINIPEGVTAIKDNVFFDCASLAKIELPSGITAISTGTFSGCTLLESVDIPESVMSIGKRAFIGCSNLTSMNVPESVTSIDERAFVSTSILKDIYITPNANLSYTDGSFDACLHKTLHLVRTSANKKKINEMVKNCTSLFKAIIIEDELPFCLSVGEEMFATLYLDHAVSIPSNLIAVFYCKALSGNKVKMYRQTSVIPAYTAVVVMANSGDYYFSPVETNKKVYGNILKGVTEDTDVSDLGENVLTFSHTPVMGFYSGISDVVKANTAYVSSGDASVKELFLGFFDTTDIDGISEEIPEDDAYYTLQGVKVDIPVAGGIYIRGGKKILVK